MRPRAAILILLFSLPGALRGQGASAGLSDTLAEVGSKVITTRDLVDRLELMPWPGKEADSAKIKALRSLVAEEILGLESGAEGIVPDSALQAYAGNLEKLFVRDELYKRQVRGKTTVAEKDVREGVRRFARRVRILMIGAPGEAAARVLSRSLRAGGDPDSVIHEAAGRYPLPADTVVVTFGLLDRSQEDAVYALTPEVPATDPLLTGRGGWVVLLLLDQVTDPEYAKRSIPDRIEKVKERIRKRNELVRAEKYQVELLSPRRAETRPAPFELLARTVRRILASDSARYSTPNGYRFDRGVDVAMDSLAGHLREVLVELPGGRMTIGDVLEGYRTYESVFPTLATADFLRRMNASIRDIVGRELLAREAYRLGLDRAEDVRHDVDLWSHYWRARALMEKLTGDVRVTNDEVLRVLEGKADVIGRDYEINIREILSDSLREALACMEKIVAGGDMKELARRYSRRAEWGARGGESGYFPLADHPALGIRALDSAPGTLVGPVRLPEGYSIFTLLDRRRVPGDTTFAFDSLKTVIRAALEDAAIRGRLNSAVASYAGRYDVRFHYDRLAKTDIPPVNMVTRRMIGFGGSILAVPSLYPLWEWTGLPSRRIAP